MVKWLCAEFFRFCWGGMTPLLVCFLGFRLVVVDPCFIFRKILPRKPSPALKYFKISWQASTRRSFNSAVIWGGTYLADTSWNCRTS